MKSILKPFWLLVGLIASHLLIAQGMGQGSTGNGGTIITDTLYIRPTESKEVDAYIQFNAGNITIQDANFSTSGVLLIDAWTESGYLKVSRSLLRWDLSSIPTGSTVQSATMELFHNTTLSTGNSTEAGSNEVHVERITEDWDGSTVSWTTQPNSDTVGRSIIPTDNPIGQRYLHSDASVEVTNMIQYFVDNPTENYGFKLKLDTEEYYRRKTYFSSDYSDTTKHPRLVIIYQQPANIHASCTPAKLRPIGETSPYDGIEYSYIHDYAAHIGEQFIWEVDGADFVDSMPTDSISKKATVTKSGNSIEVIWSETIHIGEIKVAPATPCVQAVSNSSGSGSIVQLKCTTPDIVGKKTVCPNAIEAYYSAKTADWTIRYYKNNVNSPIAVHFTNNTKIALINTSNQNGLPVDWIEIEIAEAYSTQCSFNNKLVVNVARLFNINGLNTVNCGESELYTVTSNIGTNITWSPIGSTNGWELSSYGLVSQGASSTFTITATDQCHNSTNKTISKGNTIPPTPLVDPTYADVNNTVYTNASYDGYPSYALWSEIVDLCSYQRDFFASIIQRNEGYIGSTWEIDGGAFFMNELGTANFGNIHFEPKLPLKSFSSVNINFNNTSNEIIHLKVKNHFDCGVSNYGIQPIDMKPRPNPPTFATVTDGMPCRDANGEATVTTDNFPSGIEYLWTVRDINNQNSVYRFQNGQMITVDSKKTSVNTNKIGKILGKNINQNDIYIRINALNKCSHYPINANREIQPKEIVDQESTSYYHTIIAGIVTFTAPIGINFPSSYCAGANTFTLYNYDPGIEYEWDIFNITSSGGVFTDPGIYRGIDMTSQTYDFGVDNSSQQYPQPGALKNFQIRVTARDCYNTVIDYYESSLITVNYNCGGGSFGITLSPNPAKNLVTINIPQTNNGVANIVISDSYGYVRKNVQTTATIEVVDVSDLPFGIYNVSVTKGNDFDIQQLQVLP